MLRVCRRGEVEETRELTPEEDRALRAAFGRFSVPAARAAGSAVVQRYQHAGAGHWFACSCLGPGVRPPVLVPVAEAHIRRHQDPPWPAHAEECDFHRDPDEQRLMAASYARPRRGDLVRLVGKLRAGESPALMELRGRSYARGRGALATLLAELLVRAGLNRIGPDGSVPKIAEQFRSLRTAARDIPLERDVLLSEFLCTYAPALSELLARVDGAPPARFRRTRRPHGVLLAVVAGASQGRLHPLRGEAIVVRGPIAVFGERDGHGRDGAAEWQARAPYLAACLVGRATPDGPVEVLKAYLHPCAGPGHLMLVDSDLERRTLAQLLRLQAWLLRQRGITVTIEKPLFDIGYATAPAVPAEAESALAFLEQAKTAHRETAASLREPGIKHRPEGDEDAREPCLPDFLLWARPVPHGGREAVIVETMGYPDALYRERKARSHALMRHVLGGAPLVSHDFHLPADQSQPERDRRFWLECRWAVTGPEERAPGIAPTAGVPGRASDARAR